MNQNERGNFEPEGESERPGREPSGGKVQRDWASLWERVESGVLQVLALLGVAVLFLGLATALAGWYTSRPEFCRSCHNMVPYYESWKHSSHNQVACTKCHFPPGVGEKIRGKLLGLVQVAKYVTRTESPRPAAEVSDASCLRSGCHETRLLAGKVDFLGILFDHTPHLQEVRRGMKLRCTSCHSQIVQGQHMTVTASTCFLCHFKNQYFNEGLGTCTRCHQIPDQPFELGGGIQFSHDLAYERGVDCANCHSDLVRGQGEVPRERCIVCHNREGDLKRISETDFIHQKHVSEHKVDCLECHLEIRHSLDPQKIEHAASDCQSCHPDHHREQVELLTGVGAALAPSLPNEMVSVRIACPTCHKTPVVSTTGTTLRKATTEACLLCHDPSQAELLVQHYDAVRAALPELNDAVARVREALTKAKLPDERKSEISDLLQKAQKDLALVQAANPIHNIHYATTILRNLLQKLGPVCRELKVKEPQVQLPEGIGKAE